MGSGQSNRPSGMAAPMPNQDTVQFSVRVPIQHMSVLERRAREEDRSVSAEIRRLIRRYVEEVGL